MTMSRGGFSARRAGRTLSASRSTSGSTLNSGPTERQIYRAAVIRSRAAEALGEKNPPAVDKIIADGKIRFGE